MCIALTCPGLSIWAALDETHYCELAYNDFEDYWELPISWLAEIANANGYHGSVAKARANYVAGRFHSKVICQCIKSANVAWDAFRPWHGCLSNLRIIKQVIALEPLPMVHMRKRKNGDFVQLLRDSQTRRRLKTEGCDFYSLQPMTLSNRFMDCRTIWAVFKAAC
ncbi:hypothetical protein ACT691_13500 [Vibrio metschnikovii]